MWLYMALYVGPKQFKLVLATVAEVHEMLTVHLSFSLAFFDPENCPGAAVSGCPTGGVFFLFLNSTCFVFVCFVFYFP